MTSSRFRILHAFRRQSSLKSVRFSPLFGQPALECRHAFVRRAATDSCPARNSSLMKSSEHLLSVPGFRGRSLGIGVGIGIGKHWLQMQNGHTMPAKQHRFVCNLLRDRYIQRDRRQKRGLFCVRFCPFLSGLFRPARSMAQPRNFSKKRGKARHLPEAEKWRGTAAPLHRSFMFLPIGLRERA